MQKGLIFDIQRFSIHDGPGMRTVIFFKGCPLNCVWCQNPESINPKPELGFRKDNCVKCGDCSDICPENAIKNNPLNFKRVKCKVSEGCRKCVNKCLTNALEIAGRIVTVEDLMKSILKDKDYYDNSGGGITCSGGEPTYQWPFVYEFLKSCKKTFISTAIETCGYFYPKIIDDLYNVCDIVLFDIKHLDINRHEQLTGRKNNLILQNLKKFNDLCQNNKMKKLILRLPLIPTLNDSLEHLNRIERLLLRLEINSLVILPYHSLYLNKIDVFGLKRKKLKIKPYQKSDLEKVKCTFKKLEILIGG